MLRLLVIVLVSLAVMIPLVDASIIECDITTIPLTFEEMVASDSFHINVTIVNKANESFPPDEFSVQILDPSGRLPQDHFAFDFKSPLLNSSGSNFTYTHMWFFDPDQFAIFEMTRSGVWTVNISLKNHTGEDVLILIDGKQYVNEGRDLFFVWNKDIYELYRSNEYLRSDTIKAYQNNEKLTVTIMFLAIITVLVSFFRFEFKKFEGHGHIVSSVAIFVILFLLYGIVDISNITTQIFYVVMLITACSLLFKERVLKRWEAYAYTVYFVLAPLSVFLFTIIMYQSLLLMEPSKLTTISYVQNMFGMLLGIVVSFIMIKEAINSLPENRGRRS